MDYLPIPAVGVIALMITLSAAAAFSEVKDYCQTETFTAKCNTDEVVLMTSAYYGRMVAGRCVKQDYGFIGCSRDVLRLADLKCSGRHECEIRIPDSNFDLAAREKCPDDLKTYFQASFTCLKVAAMRKELCQSSSYIKLSAEQGYLSSAVARETGCGAGTSFWIIEAKPGQKVNLTVMDFSSATLDSDSRMASTSVDMCRELFIVKDNSKATTIQNCNINTRDSWVYTSESNSVEIEFIDAPSTTYGLPQFLIHFSSVGCADPQVPEGTWMKREGNTAALGCSGGEGSWRLECRAGKWFGGMGNCSAGGIAVQPSTMWNFMSLPNELSIFIIILIALFIGAVILGIGLLYVKRRNREQLARASDTAFGDVAYAPGLGKMPPGGGPGSNPASKTIKYDENEYALIWELQNTQAARAGDPYTRRPLPPYPRTNSREDTLSHTYQCAEPCQQCQLDSPKYFELDPKDHPGVGTGDPHEHRLGPHMMGHHST